MRRLMDNRTVQMRLMNDADFALFDSIQKAAYRALFLETEAVFRRRVQLFPEGNWICEDRGRPVGYLVCHPWRLNEVVVQNAVDIQLPRNPDCFYIHSAT